MPTRDGSRRAVAEARRGTAEAYHARVMNPTLFYFLPILVALVFVLAHLARGGKLTARTAHPRQVALAVSAVIALGVIGALIAFAAMR